MEKVMKHMRKALSLLLVLAMVVCFAVPAFAASPEGATVTVYITEDLFTKGGIDTATGKKIDQEYIGGIPTSYIKKVEVDISGISTTELKTLKHINFPHSVSCIEDIHLKEFILPNFYK